TSPRTPLADPSAKCSGTRSDDLRLRLAACATAGLDNARPAASAAAAPKPAFNTHRRPTGVDHNSPNNDSVSPSSRNCPSLIKLLLKRNGAVTAIGGDTDAWARIGPHRRPVIFH